MSLTTLAKENIMTQTQLNQLISYDDRIDFFIGLGMYEYARTIRRERDQYTRQITR